MIQIKRILIIVVLLSCCFAGCRKKDANTPDYKIVLAPIEASGRVVTLNWAKPNGLEVTDYVIVRVEDTLDQYSPISVKRVVLDKNVTQYTDTLPVTPYTQYYVMADILLDGKSALITSNKRLHVRTDITFVVMDVKDVLYDREHEMLYLYGEHGDIAQYDIAAKAVVKQIKLTSDIGLGDIGQYDGKTELYMPRYDGGVSIIDAATLTETAHIFDTGVVTNVVYNEGKIFVWCTALDMITTFYRPNLRQIAQVGGDTYMRMRLLPGTNSEMCGCRDNGDVFYYKFNDFGRYVSSNTHYFYNYSTQATLLEMFPDGSKFITSTNGVIISKNLGYVATLPHEDMIFSSFGFDGANQKIYAGCNRKEIQVFSMADYSLSSTIATTGYPFKVFYNNGKVISINSKLPYEMYYRPSTVFIEQL